MSDKHLWYTMIPERYRQVVDATAKWLRPVPWQWFITLTFPWDVRSETADAKLKAWLNSIEKTLRVRVCFVAGKERKAQSHGMEVPWHFHLLVTSMVEMPKNLLEGSWRKLVSSAGRRRDKDDTIGVRLAADVNSVSEDRLRGLKRKDDSVFVRRQPLSPINDNQNYR